MPRLRSQTNKSALRLLPREVLARCIEFLPFDHALVIKHVSKEFPKLAARFVFDLLAQHLNPRVDFVDIGDHRRWSRDWQDREKARAFLNAARELNVYEDTGFDVAPPTA